MKYYILNVKAGRELFIHELLAREGFKCYTPFENKFQRPVSRKARKERQPTRAYADPLFKTYLFVGSDQDEGQTLMAFDYIIQRRADVYSVFADRGEPFALNDAMMQKWQESLHTAHTGRKNYVLRGYDPRRDARKNQTRLYGAQMITIPTFTVKEKVEFMRGGFTGISAEVSEINDEFITVLANVFGAQTKIKVDPYELKKVG